MFSEMRLKEKENKEKKELPFNEEQLEQEVNEMIG
jgi:hypothetical protein